MTLQPLKRSLSVLCSLLSSVLLLGACRSPAPDPAPPPASYELAPAPPGARGARAAGTDAAPPPPSEGVLHVPGTDDEDEAEPEEEDAGAEGDASAAPDAGGGVAL